jgi:histidine ammonia-lyase
MSGSECEIVLDGHSLDLESIVRVARDPGVRVRCDAEAMKRVARGREQILEVVRQYEAAIASGEAAPNVYGITTGFGEFKRERIAPAKLEQLQRNILLSHAVGVGDTPDADDPGNYFTAEVVRATLCLRINAFLKGHSGVRVELVECLVAMLNAGIVPLVPIRGSLGSSGDLCPLCHLFVVLLGEGRYFRVATRSDLANSFAGRTIFSGRELARDLGMTAIPAPSFKEGLALSNGATVSAALLALATHDAERLAVQADINAGMSLEAVCGRARALDPKVHAVRGMVGQIASAANIRALIRGSEWVDRAEDVQDVYSLRCAPQVHGASRDAIAYAKMVIEHELNAATDNPLFFPDAGEPWDVEAFADNRAAVADTLAYSAGNFHGQPLGLAADFLAIAVAELANISERRLQLLLDRTHSRGLPANLIPDRGVNSGFMIMQYSAASLVSENKVIAHPASVDSIPASANSEDHNAMSTIAARKLRTVVANTECVLAMEMTAAAQALEWRAGVGISGAGLSSEQASDADRQFAAEGPQSVRATTAAKLGVGSRAAYQAIRGHIAPMLTDRMLDGDVRIARELIRSGVVIAAVRDVAVVGGVGSIGPISE